MMSVDDISLTLSFMTLVTTLFSFVAVNTMGDNTRQKDSMKLYKSEHRMT